MPYTDFEGVLQMVPAWSVWLGFAIYIVVIVEMWVVFVKAGKPGWAALVPFYNMYTEFAVAWKGSYFFFTFIPFVGLVFAIMCLLKLAKAFGKSTGFGVGLIFLPFIFMGLLAFGDAKYVGAQVTTNN